MKLRRGEREALQSQNEHVSTWRFRTFTVVLFSTTCDVWPKEYWGKPFIYHEDGMGPARFDERLLKEVVRPPKDVARPPGLEDFKEAETPKTSGFLRNQ